MRAEGPHSTSDVLGRMLRIITRYMRRKDTARAANVLKGMHPADIGALINNMPEEWVGPVFDLIQGDETKADVFSHCNAVQQGILAESFNQEQVLAIMRKLESDDAADLISLLKPELAEEVLEKLSALKDMRGVQDLVAYPETSAGGIMTTNYIVLRESETVGEATQRLKEKASAESLHYLYVLDQVEMLRGIVSLRDLLLSPDDRKVSEIMNRKVIHINVFTDQEEVARIVSRYDLLAIPVMDDSGRMLGVVTVDDVIDVMRQEATEDFLRLAGTSEEEIVETSAIARAKHRLPWLAVATVGYFFTSQILRGFQDTIQELAVMAAYIPLITGMGGNVGSQSSIIIVRGLATGRIHISQALRVLFDELAVAVLLGIAFGVVIGIAAEYLQGDMPTYFGAVVAVGLFISMVLAAGVGAMVPMFFYRVGMDPAVATSPFVTTIIDFLGITSYFMLTRWLLAHPML